MNLDKSILDKIIEISKKHDNVYKVVLFGSRARGDNSLKSDIDLAVYSNDNIFDFIEEIENNAPTLLEFDFTEMENIDDELLIKQIEKDGIVLYEEY